jgi:hypothetical protein
MPVSTPTGMAMSRRLGPPRSSPRWIVNVAGGSIASECA